MLQLVEKSAFELLMLGISAGFLIAALVSMLPSAEGSNILGGHHHHLYHRARRFGPCRRRRGGGVSDADRGRILLWHAFGGVLLPMLIGNVLGGTALFSLIAYAQVREEI